VRWLLAISFLCATLGVPAHGPLSAEFSGPTTPEIAAPDPLEHEPPTAFAEEPTASEVSLIECGASAAPILLAENRDWPDDNEPSSAVADVPVPPPIA
jgi:hypothetical protein